MAWVNSTDSVIAKVQERLTLADGTAVLADKLTYQKQAAAMALMVQARYLDMQTSTLDGGSAWRTKYLNQADAAMTAAINASTEAARTGYTDQVEALARCASSACYAYFHNYHGGQ